MVEVMPRTIVGSVVMIPMLRSAPIMAVVKLMLPTYSSAAVDGDRLGLDVERGRGRVEAHVHSAGDKGVERRHPVRVVRHSQVDGDAPLGGRDQRLHDGGAVQLFVLGIERGAGAGGPDQLDQGRWAPGAQINCEPLGTTPRVGGLWLCLKSASKVAATPATVEGLSVTTIQPRITA